MPEKRTVTIESPSGNILQVQIHDDLVDKFVGAATKKDGPWRGRRDTFQSALESAVASALNKFVEVGSFE